MKRLILVFVGVCLVCGVSCLTLNAKETEQLTVQEGRTVSFDYTLTVEGKEVDSSQKHGAPLKYVHGDGQIIPGLSDQLEGMKPGEEKKITVSSDEAYGDVNPDAFKEFGKDSLPEGLDSKVGMYLNMRGPGGRTIPAKITEVKEESIIVDLNYPLAGKKLTFDVKIVSVEE